MPIKTMRSPYSRLAAAHGVSSYGSVSAREAKGPREKEEFRTYVAFEDVFEISSVNESFGVCVCLRGYFNHPGMRDALIQHLHPVDMLQGSAKALGKFKALLKKTPTEAGGAAAGAEANTASQDDGRAPDTTDQSYADALARAKATNEGRFAKLATEGYTAQLDELPASVTQLCPGPT